MNRPSWILKASCTDTVGIVAAVSGFLAERSALITEMSHFVDDDAQKSFVRVEFEDDAEGEAGLAELSAQYRDGVARRFGMRFEFYPSGQKMKTLVAVSKQSHCIYALLHRWWDGHRDVPGQRLVGDLQLRHGHPDRWHRRRHVPRVHLREPAGAHGD